MSDTQTEKNTSGHGKMAEIPEEVRGWSWGAFLLTWIWGIGNSTYRALWCFVPIVNIVMWVVLGIKGREWAWRNRRWENIEAFNKAQKRWSTAGLIIFVVFILLYAGIFLGIFSTLQHATPTKMAVQYVQQSSQIQAVLGTPIKRTGLVQGSIETNDGAGSAAMHFPVSGPKSAGEIYYKACKVQGTWYLSQISYQDNASQDNNVQLQTTNATLCGGPSS